MPHHSATMVDTIRALSAHGSDGSLRSQVCCSSYWACRLAGIPVLQQVLYSGNHVVSLPLYLAETACCCLSMRSCCCRCAVMSACSSHQALHCCICASSRSPFCKVKSQHAHANFVGTHSDKAWYAKATCCELVVDLELCGILSGHIMPGCHSLAATVAYRLASRLRTANAD